MIKEVYEVIAVDFPGILKGDAGIHRLNLVIESLLAIEKNDQYNEAVRDKAALTLRMIQNVFGVSS